MTTTERDNPHGGYEAEGGMNPMTKHEELERLARAATQHVTGDWHHDKPETWVWAGDPRGGRAHIADIRGWGYLTGRGGGLALDEGPAFEQQKAWGAFVAAANPETILALLSANREMREEPRVLAITLEGMQGEPAGMMTVGVQMTDGQKFDLIRTNGTVISHWARLPDAEARSALTTQRGVK